MGNTSSSSPEKIPQEDFIEELRKRFIPTANVLPSENTSGNTSSPGPPVTKITVNDFRKAFGDSATPPFHVKPELSENTPNVTNTQPNLSNNVTDGNIIGDNHLPVDPVHPNTGVTLNVPDSNNFIDDVDSSISDDEKTKDEKKRIKKTKGQMERATMEILLRFQGKPEKKDKYILRFRRSLEDYVFGACFMSCYQITYLEFTVHIMILFSTFEVTDKIIFALGFYSIALTLLLAFYFQENDAALIVLLAAIVGIFTKCKIKEIELVKNSENEAMKVIIFLCQVLYALAFASILACSLPANFVVGCYYGYKACSTRFSAHGKREIVSVHADVIDVTLQQFLEDFYKEEGYCFIRVLKKDDQIKFITALMERYQTEFVLVYKTRSMQLAMWKKIMNELQLSFSYIVYRQAYWGENTGRRKVSDRLTNCIVPLFSFERYTARAAGTGFDSLLSLFEYLTIDSEVRILATNNFHMEIIEKKTFYRRSGWHNLDFTLDDEKFYE